MTSAADFASRCAALDTLAARLGPDEQRAVPILGSRHDYYRKTGQVAPTLDPATEDLARRTARSAIADLRGTVGDRVLEQARIQATCELEPVEIVPGQQVTALWTLGAARATRLEQLKRVSAASHCRCSR